MIGYFLAQIRGLGTFMTKTDLSVREFNEYMTIAEKMIALHCPKAFKARLLNDCDAVSNITYAIINADANFNGKGNKYGYRKQCAKWAIYNYIKELNRYNTVSLNNTVKQNDGGEFLDLFAQDVSADPLEKQDDISLLLEMIDSLPKKTSKYMKMHYIDGLDVNQITQQCNVTKQAVYLALSKGVKTLKNQMTERNLV